MRAQKGQVSFSVISQYLAKAKFELWLPDSRIHALFPASGGMKADTLRAGGGGGRGARPPERPAAIHSFTPSFRAHASMRQVSRKEGEVK